MWFVSICCLWTLKGSHCPHLIPSKGQRRCLAVLFMQPIRWANSNVTHEGIMKRHLLLITWLRPETLYSKNTPLTPIFKHCKINKLKIGINTFLPLDNSYVLFCLFCFYAFQRGVMSWAASCLFCLLTNWVLSSSLLSGSTRSQAYLSNLIPHFLIR